MIPALHHGKGEEGKLRPVLCPQRTVSAFCAAW